MLTGYYSEMGEKRPDDTEIDARLAHYGRHWFLTTRLELKGRGVTFLGKITAERLVDGENSPKCGCNEYKVTDAAFKRLCEEYKISSESLL